LQEFELPREHLPEVLGQYEDPCQVLGHFADYSSE